MQKVFQARPTEYSPNLALIKILKFNPNLYGGGGGGGKFGLLT